MWFYRDLLGFSILFQGTSGEARAAMLRVLCVWGTQGILGRWQLEIHWIWKKWRRISNWNPPKVEVPPFSDRPTICQWFHVVPVPRASAASPSPRAFVRAPPCVWQSRWCGPKQCSVRRNPPAFFLWNPRCSSLSAQLAEGYNDLFGLQLNGLEKNQLHRPGEGCLGVEDQSAGAICCSGSSKHSGHRVLDDQKHFQVVLWLLHFIGNLGKIYISSLSLGLCWLSALGVPCFSWQLEDIFRDLTTLGLQQLPFDTCTVATVACLRSYQLNSIYRIYHIHSTETWLCPIVLRLIDWDMCGSLTQIFQTIMYTQFSRLKVPCFGAFPTFRQSHIILLPICHNMSISWYPHDISKYLPSGKQPHSYGKSPSSMGKSTINGPWYLHDITIPIEELCRCIAALADSGWHPMPKAGFPHGWSWHVSCLAKKNSRPKMVGTHSD